MHSTHHFRFVLGLVGSLASALAGACTARGEPPPYTAELSRWAQQSDYALSSYRNCTGIEEEYFGAMGSVCWTAKRRTPQPGSLYPRMALTLAVYRDEQQARARLARFHENLPLKGEQEKTYPLRAAFRKGSHVLVVTTDALVFLEDVKAAAKALAQQLQGTDVTLW